MVQALGQPALSVSMQKHHLMNLLNIRSPGPITKDFLIMAVVGYTEENVLGCRQNIPKHTGGIKHHDGNLNPSASQGKLTNSPLLVPHVPRQLRGLLDAFMSAILD